MTEEKDNNQALRELWESTGLSQPQALALINANQARPLALSTFKAYLATPDASRRRDCPKEILDHAKKVLGKLVKDA